MQPVALQPNWYLRRLGRWGETGNVLGDRMSPRVVTAKGGSIPSRLADEEFLLPNGEP